MEEHTTTSESQVRKPAIIGRMTLDENDKGNSTYQSVMGADGAIKKERVMEGDEPNRGTKFSYERNDGKGNIIAAACTVYPPYNKEPMGKEIADAMASGNGFSKDLQARMSRVALGAREAEQPQQKEFTNQDVYKPSGKPALGQGFDNFEPDKITRNGDITTHHFNKKEVINAKLSLNKDGKVVATPTGDAAELVRNNPDFSKALETAARPLRDSGATPPKTASGINAASSVRSGQSGPAQRAH